MMHFMPGTAENADATGPPGVFDSVVTENVVAAALVIARGIGWPYSQGIVTVVAHAALFHYSARSTLTKIYAICIVVADTAFGDHHVGSHINRVRRIIAAQ